MGVGQTVRQSVRDEVTFRCSLQKRRQLLLCRFLLHQPFGDKDAQRLLPAVKGIQAQTLAFGYKCARCLALLFGLQQLCCRFQLGIFL